MNARIKLVYIGCYAATFALGAFSLGVNLVLSELGEPGLGEIAGALVMLPAVLTLLGWFGASLVWVYDAWSSIPEEHREVAIFGNITPALAVGLFFVPCMNVAWMFLCNIGIVTSINRSLEAQGSRERLSMGFPLAACVLHVVPYCNFLFGPIFWFAYMVQADRARRTLGPIDAARVADVFA